MSKTKIKKGDLVEVIAGKNVGMRGKVLQVLPKKERVLVEKVNYVYKHEKARGNRRAGILEIEAPIHISNVMVVSPKDNKPTRVKKVELSDGNRARACARTGEVLEK